MILGLSLALGGCVAQGDPVAARMAAQVGSSPVANPGPVCSAEQSTVVAEAYAEARRHLGQAVNFIRQYPGDPHVRRWFGEAPAGVTLATLEATAARMDRADGVRLECNDAQVCADGKIAYARLRSGRLGVCPRFFETGSGGLDSRFGILIHEMTHIAARTGDHAYRPNGAARIAYTDPTLAARNADNYQYFVETLPTLRTARKDEHVPSPEEVEKPVVPHLVASDATTDRIGR
jgi:hypothetical protein